MRTHSFVYGRVQPSAGQHVDQIARHTATTARELIMFVATLIVATLVMGSLFWMIASVVAILQAVLHIA